MLWPCLGCVKTRRKATGAALPAPNPRHRPLAAATLLCFAVVSAALVWNQLRRDATAPSRESWAELAEALAPALRPGDLVRIVPTWDLEGLTALQRLRPGDPWPFRDFDWRDPVDPLVFMRAERVVLAGWSKRMDRARRELPSGAGPPVRLADAPGLVALGIALPESPLHWSANDHLGEAVVRRLGPGAAVSPCTWNGKEHHCPGRGDWWMQVHRRLSDAGGTARECIYVEPYPSGSRVEVRFPAVPLTPSTVLMLRMGNTIQGARRPEGSDPWVELEVGGRRVLRDSWGKNDYLWIPWVLPWTAADTEMAGLRPEVKLMVGVAEAGWRQICFDLSVLGPGWEDWGTYGWGHLHGEPVRPVPLRWLQFERAARR